MESICHALSCKSCAMFPDCFHSKKKKQERKWQKKKKRKWQNSIMEQIPSLSLSFGKVYVLVVDNMWYQKWTNYFFKILSILFTFLRVYPSISPSFCSLFPVFEPKVSYFLPSSLSAAQCSEVITGLHCCPGSPERGNVNSALHLLWPRPHTHHSQCRTRLWSIQHLINVTETM